MIQNFAMILMFTWGVKVPINNNHEKLKILSIDMKCPREYPFLHIVYPTSMAPTFNMEGKILLLDYG